MPSGRVPHHVADACDDDEQARADAADVEAEAELFRPARRFTHGEIHTSLRAGRRRPVSRRPPRGGVSSRRRLLAFHEGGRTTLMYDSKRGTGR